MKGLHLWLDVRRLSKTSIPFRNGFSYLYISYSLSYMMSLKNVSDAFFNNAQYVSEFHISWIFAFD